MELFIFEQQLSESFKLSESLGVLIFIFIANSINPTKILLKVILITAKALKTLRKIIINLNFQVFLYLICGIKKLKFNS